MYLPVQVPFGTDRDTSVVLVDHSERDYANIDFATTQQMDKSVLKVDSDTSHFVLPPKGLKRGSAIKNMGSSADKSGYVKV